MDFILKVIDGKLRLVPVSDFFKLKKPDIFEIPEPKLPKLKKVGTYWKGKKHGNK